VRRRIETTENYGLRKTRTRLHVDEDDAGVNAGAPTAGHPLEVVRGSSNRRGGVMLPLAGFAFEALHDLLEELLQVGQPRLAGRRVGLDDVDLMIERLDLRQLHNAPPSSLRVLGLGSGQIACVTFTAFRTARGRGSRRPASRTRAAER